MTKTIIESFCKECDWVEEQEILDPEDPNEIERAEFLIREKEDTHLEQTGHDDFNRQKKT